MRNIWPVSWFIDRHYAKLEARLEEERRLVAATEERLARSEAAGNDVSFARDLLKYGGSPKFVNGFMDDRGI